MADKDPVDYKLPDTSLEQMPSTPTELQQFVLGQVTKQLNSLSDPLRWGQGNKVFLVDDDGLRMGGSTFSTAPIRMGYDGSATFANVTITGGSVPASLITGTFSSAALNIADRGWTQTCAFSVTDSDTIAWGAGTFTASDGTAYSIGAGNTGNMAARTFIYLDINVSTTAYQTTTTAATAIGAGKVMIAVAQNNTTEAIYTLLGAPGTSNIDASSVVAGSITANELAAGSVTATKINVSSLSAITADLGSITAGSISVANGGNTIGFTPNGTNAIFSGPTGAPTFYVTPAGVMTATGAVVNGSQILNQDIFGDGSDGTATISSNTSLARDMFYNDLTIDSGFTLNTAGFRLHVKGTLTVNGTVGRPGNAGSAGGDASGNTGGSAGAGGAALADGSLKGAVAGIAGTAGGNGGTINGSQNLTGTAAANGAAGNSVTKSATAANGVVGGLGGGWNSDTIGQASNGSSGTNHAGAIATIGAAGTVSGTVFNTPKTVPAAWLLQDFFPSQDSIKSSAGSTGGTGGASGARMCSSGSANSGAGGGGGGAGSPGGLVGIYARTIIVGASGVITAKGGAGGNGGAASAGSGSGSGFAGGGNSGGGGGGGGSGGLLVYVYSSLTNSGSITVAGGAGGTGGAKGAGISTSGFQNSTWGWWNGADGATGTTGNAGLAVPLQV